MIAGTANEKRDLSCNVHYELKGPLISVSTVVEEKHEYTMRINYYSLEDLIKDLDSRLIDEIAGDPRLKKLVVTLHNPNWVEPEKRNPPVFLQKSS